MIPKSLAGRFFLIITIPIIIGQIIAIYIFFSRHWYNVNDNMNNVTMHEIKLFVDIFQNNPSLAPKVANELGFFYDFYAISKRENKLKIRREEIASLRDALLQNIPYPSSVFYLNKTVTVDIELDNGLLSIYLPHKRVLTPTTLIFVAWIVILTILLLSISIIFMKNQIKAILDLTKAADAFGSGKSSFEYKPSGALEIRKAGIAFLKMKSRIESYISKRTQMLAMISHDLKTPLTRIKLALDLMQNTEEVNDIKKDVHDMEHMIGTYLDFAKGEKGEDFTLIELDDYIKSIIKQFRFSKLEIVLNLNCSQRLKIRIYAFKRAVYNLLDNASKYASKIQISSYVKNDKIFIDFEDNGVGISDIEKDKVFAPFYRIDYARNINNKASVGLGLSITQEIILSHKGDVILLDSKNLGGLNVRFIFHQST